MGAGAALVGLGVLGAVQQGQMARQAGRQANATAKYNAAVSEQEAKAAEDKAAVDESIHRDRTKKALSTLRARIGKSGVTSPAQAKAIEESIGAAEMDALTIRHSGKVEAGRLRSGAKVERIRGESAAKAGKLAQRASTIRAGTSLLSAGMKRGGKGGGGGSDLLPGRTIRTSVPSGGRFSTSIGTF